MQTQIQQISAVAPEENIIQQAGAILRGGGLVAFPTETVYGLGADALQPAAAKKIYAAKGRPSDNPLIIHIAKIAALEKITAEIPPQALALAEAFWPGPLTMIFKKSDAVPYETTGGLDTVAVRLPSHAVAVKLIEAAGGYVAAPSANASGRPSPTMAARVFEDLNGKIPMILDGGAVGIGIESTIVDVSGITKNADGTWDVGQLPMILRPGFITKEMLARVIGEIRTDPGLSPETDMRPKAPGMKYRHYAPKADMKIVQGDAPAVVEFINERTKAARQQGKKVGVLCCEETADAYRTDLRRCLGSRQDEAAIARHLYEALRDMDDAGAEEIFAEDFSALQLGEAIMNRLLKAAAHQVITL